MSQTLGHDGWLGARSCPPFNHHPRQVYWTPKPKTHVQTEALFITESATSWVLCSGICYSVSWGDLLLFACFVWGVFFLAFSLLSSLSFKDLWSHEQVCHDFFQRWDLLSETELWPGVLLEAVCLNLGHTAHWCAIILLCDNWFFFYKVVLHFMRPYFIFHTTTPDEFWEPRWTTPCHLLKSSSPWKGTHKEETHHNKWWPAQKTTPQTF